MPRISDSLFRKLRALARLGPVSVRIDGTCMHPALANGVTVAVHGAPWYVPGDVLVFRDRQDVLVSHRLIAYRLLDGTLHYVTRADTAARADAPVPRERVLGRVSTRAYPVSPKARVRAVRRGLGYIARGAWARLTRAA